MRRDDRQRELACERDGGADQRVVVGASSALYLQEVAIGKPRRTLAPALGGADRVALQQRMADVAVTRARERDDAVGAFGEPGAADFRTAAVLIREIGARQPVAEFEVTAMRRRQQHRAKRL